MIRSLRALRPGTAGSVVVGLAIAALVIYPLTGTGWVLILDWVNGPSKVFPAGVFGLALPPTPLPLVLRAVGDVLGPARASWVLIAVIFPVAVVGIVRLFPRRGIASIAGGIFYAVNPFVFERLGAGQIPFLLGYALLPFLLSSLLRSRSAQGLRAVLPAAWIGLATLCSIHYVWLSGVLLLAVFVADRQPRRTRWLVGNALAAAVVTVYVELPSLVGGKAQVAVGAADLDAYRTAGDATFGLGVNVLGLYGFWRSGTRLPKDVLSGWVVLLVALLLVAAVGGISAWRSREHRPLVLVCALSCTVGFLLSLGEQGPTGWLYKRMFFDLPGFAVMRESEKFSSLLALGLAVLFAFGGARLLSSASSPAVGRVTGALIVGLPFAYTPTLFGGLDGQVAVAQYPHSWYEARALMGQGPGKILFLPWHQYMQFDFTKGVIGTPADVFFNRQVISGDNAEVGYHLETDSTSPRSAYLEQLYARGPGLTNFGRLVAQLGVSYVVLSHSVDYLAYGWLQHQQDLKEVMGDGELTVWRNLDALPSGTRTGPLVTVPSLAAYITLADKVDLRGAAVVVRPGRPETAMPVPPSGEVRERSQTSFAVASGRAGWVVLPVDANAGWQVSGRSGVTLADGVTALRVSAAPDTAEFEPWTLVVIGYLVALSAIGGLAGLALVDRIKNRDRSIGPSPHP